MINKKSVKGQSKIIVSIMLVLIAIMGVVVVFNVVNPILSDKAEESERIISKLKLPLLFVEDFSVNEEGDEASVRLDAGSGEGIITRVQFVFETSDADCFVEGNVNIQSLESESLVLDISSCDSVLGVKGVEVLDWLVKSIGIDSCGVLDDSKGVYVLVQDIHSNSDDFSCLGIEEDGILLDCQGHKLTLSGKGNGISSSNEGIVIRNCNVEYTHHPGTENHAKAIVLKGSGFRLYNNQVIGANTGLYLPGVSKGIIDGLIVENTKYDGLWLGASDSRFKNIELNNNEGNGIYVSGGDNNDFENIIAENNGQGIKFELSSYCNVEDSEFRNSRDNGISVGRSNHIVLEDLIVNDAGEYGVYLEESSDCTLENVWVSNAGDNDDGSGIKLKNSNNNVISNSISCDNNNVEGRGDFSCDGNGNSGSDNRFGSASDCGVEYSPCSCGDDCEVLYTFVLRDLDGNNLPYVSEGDIKTFQINQGEEFVIDVYVKDIIRGGIYAGYVDLNYGSNDLVDYILGSLEISSNFGSVVEGIINEPSMLVDEAGGVSTSTNTLGNGMKWLFRVKAVAVQRGIENFELNPADDFPSHYTLVYGLDSGVDVRNIEYVNARLEII